MITETQSGQGEKPDALRPEPSIAADANAAAVPAAEETSSAALADNAAPSELAGGARGPRARTFDIEAYYGLRRTRRAPEIAAPS
jgi:hypothetical protein